MMTSQGAERPDEPFRHGRRHYLVILGLTLFYLYVYYFQETFVRFGMVAAVAFVILLALESDLRFWFAVFCMVVVFGAGAIVIGEFNPDFGTGFVPTVADANAVSLGAPEDSLGFYGRWGGWNSLETREFDHQRIKAFMKVAF